MNEQIVLLCDHHHNDIRFFRYEWPRVPSAPALLVLETGSEALAFLRKCAETYRAGPNLVICEMELPDCSGLEILRLVKSTPELHEIPVIMTSATMDVEQRRQAFEAGALDCWRKPISLDSLQQVLGAMMNPEEHEDEWRKE